MSQPNREAELMDACETFWDEETEQVKAGILAAAGFARDSAFEKLPFQALSKNSQREIARIIGEALMK